MSERTAYLIRASYDRLRIVHNIRDDVVNSYQTVYSFR